MRWFFVGLVLAILSVLPVRAEVTQIDRLEKVFAASLGQDMSAKDFVLFNPENGLHVRIERTVEGYRVLFPSQGLDARFEYSNGTKVLTEIALKPKPHSHGAVTGEYLEDVLEILEMCVGFRPQILPSSKLNLDIGEGRILTNLEARLVRGPCQHYPSPIRPIRF